MRRAAAVGQTVLGWVAVVFLAVAGNAVAWDADYGVLYERMPADLTGQLARHVAPARDGAIGRNRNAYIHVRFQQGMHRLVQYGLAAREEGALLAFLDAADYAFRHQQPSGAFELTVPASWPRGTRVSAADRASGAAFFLASLGAGWVALETSLWVRQTDKGRRLLRRLDARKPQLARVLNLLKSQVAVLRKADRGAPNRLLLNALAFYACGRLLGDTEAMTIAGGFVRAAAAQVHRDGYFIEGGGYDSSYNGVATATALHLVAMGYHQHGLEAVAGGAIHWQAGRIAGSGEIRTQGNARVNPLAAGESFMGRKKDVDVAHSVEAFMLSAMVLGNTAHHQLARQVLKHYVPHGN